MLDEMASYLLQNMIIRKCDMRAKTLLDRLVYHGLPLSLYELFKNGLDVNCVREQFERILKEVVVYGQSWSNQTIFEAFQNFEINAEVACYFIASARFLGRSIFRSSVNHILFRLQIASRSNGVVILMECFDSEGNEESYLKVLGGNFHAISWFIDIGVGIPRKTTSSLTASALAGYKLRFVHGNDYPRRIFKKLSEKMQEKSRVIIQCNTELVDLSPLHIAGTHGMEIMHFVHHEIQLHKQ